MITTVIKVGLGLVFALLLNRAFKGRDFFRAIIFLPCTIGALVIGYVFTFILQPDTGVLNEFLRGIGLGGLALNWLGDPKIVLFTVCAVESWMWIGFNTAIILAGLQSISTDVYEAARLAKEANPKQLWLTHYSPSMTRPEEFMDKVRGIFPRAKAARDGWTKELVFDED